MEYEYSRAGMSRYPITGIIIYYFIQSGYVRYMVQLIYGIFTQDLFYYLKDRYRSILLRD